MKERKRQIFSQTLASVKPSKCFCFYLPHTVVPSQWTAPQNGSMCVKQSIQRETRGGDRRRGGEREKNKCHAMQTVKRVQSALQQFYSTSWAEPHWLPADKPSLISGLLAAASPALCHPRWLLHFKPPPALSSARL